MLVITQNDEQEAIMLVCEHNLSAGPSGYNTCLKCNWSELAADLNFYDNDKLNN